MRLTVISLIRTGKQSGGSSGPPFSFEPKCDVRVGSDSDILNACPERLLLRAKQTSNVRFQGQMQYSAFESAVGGRADLACQELSGPFIAMNGHELDKILP